MVRVLTDMFKRLGSLIVSLLTVPLTQHSLIRLDEDKDGRITINYDILMLMALTTP